MPWHGGGGGTNVPRQLPLVPYVPGTYHTIPFLRTIMPHRYVLSGFHSGR